MATPEGKNYIRNHTARQANAIAQQHPPPQMSHAQVNLASQQQIAQIQMQQQLQQQQQQQQQQQHHQQQQNQLQQLQAQQQALQFQNQNQNQNQNPNAQTRQQPMARPPGPQQLLARAQAQSQMIQPEVRPPPNRTADVRQKLTNMTDEQREMAFQKVGSDIEICIANT